MSSKSRLRQIFLHSEEQPLKPWHCIDVETCLSITKTDKFRGLSLKESHERLNRYGPNVLPESVPRSGFSIFINQFRSLPVALLAVAACISLFTGGIADACVIMGVVTINATIGYFTESGAERTIHSLKNLVRPTALVVRDGSIRQVSGEDIVLGDLLVLRPGCYVAADARLIEANHLSVDESVLTGESLPVLKSTAPLNTRNPNYDDGHHCSFQGKGLITETDPSSDIQQSRPNTSFNVPLANRTNMVYMGTLVTGGQGLAVVVATGKFTEIGRIQALVNEASPPQTPMERQLHQIGSKLVLISGFVCAAVFVIGILRGYGFLRMLKTSISLAVAAVPEGLPTVATTTLALGINKMKKHNILIRRLEAVETLGSVQTICLDKTGTITMNKMTVAEIHTGFERFRVYDGKFISDKGYTNPYTDDGILRLIHTCVLCNESEIFRQNGGYIVNGTPTENALIYMAISTGINVISLRKDFVLLKVIHRSESRNIMMTLHSVPNMPKRLLAIKGNPTEVLALCSLYLKEGDLLPLTEEERMTIKVANERMAGNGLRVLGVAYALMEDDFELPEDGVFLNGSFIWLGMVGMVDPIRPGVKELIRDFHRAGIDTIMITGDQSPTAYAIGKELNLSGTDEIEILDSTSLCDMPPELLNALCEKVHVFARVNPSHKLQIVQSLQSVGRVVAMTGDGINDGPALKAADIGIAMGRTGTDVAREVADVILEDDNLQTMLIAVSQGRTIYNNIRKSIHFLLSTNMSEIMVMFLGISLGLGETLNTMQLLWINLMSDIFPALALSLEPAEPDVLSKPPRDPSEPIIRKSDFKRIIFEAGVLSAGSLSVYAYGAFRYGRGQKANSLGFLALTMAQLLHAISCRSQTHSIFDKESIAANRYLNLALIGSFAIQGAVMAVPVLRNFLGIAPLSILDGVVVGAGAVLPLVVNETTKTKLRNIHT